MLPLTANPLLTKADPHVSAQTVEELQTTHRRRLNTARRELRELRSKETAANVLAGFDHETEIFALSKGQFSFLDLIQATIEAIGPATMDLSTWTASSRAIETVAGMIKGGDILSSRFLVDFSMGRRAPQEMAQIREAVGFDNVRVLPNHSKFCVLSNETWRVVIRTSMNLNVNPRFESFQIAHDPELADFLTGLFDKIWRVQPREMADGRPYEIIRHFNRDV